MLSESGLQSKTIRYLNQKEIWHVKVKQANRSGIPDIIGCCDGKLFAIELKSPSNNNKTTKLQDYELRKIQGSGGRTLVSRKWTEIISFIDGLF